MISFEDYKMLFRRQISKEDHRERVFQDNIIRPFLQSILEGYDVEPVDIKINDTEHDYCQYCGTYVNKKGETVPATPDLCIARNWNWRNKEIKVDYKFVVEIKSIFDNLITGFNPEKYNKRMKEEVARHLNAKINKKVILTDGVTWVFYTKKEGLKPVLGPISLGDLKYKTKKSHNGNRDIVERNSSKIPIVLDVEWKKGDSIVPDNDFFIEQFGCTLNPYEKEIKEYGELISTIQMFIEDSI